MEGPTPVSALIHAATMVTAGVFLVCRMSPIMEYAPFATNFIIIIGALTAFFAATVGLVQNDIKRVIAYSTCSQLGYMFVAAGVGVYSVAMFHLFTHAFFKAMLFLGAGSVIHAMHHEQDMRHYGGPEEEDPLHLLGDDDRDARHHRRRHSHDLFRLRRLLLEGCGRRKRLRLRRRPGDAAFWALIIAAVFTSFYSWRLMFLTFFGEARGNRHTHDHAHESPMTMLVPLGVLAVGAVFSGVVWYNSFFGKTDQVATFFGVEYVDTMAEGGHGEDAAHGEEAATDTHGEEAAADTHGDAAADAHGAEDAGGHGSDHHYVFTSPPGEGAIHAGPDNDVLNEAHYVPLWVKFSPFVAMILGFVTAYWFYILNPSIPGRLAASQRPLYNFLLNKWYFDEAYDFLFVRPAQWLGRFLWKGGDGSVIDGGINGLAMGIIPFFTRTLSRAQSGYIFHYAFAMVLGIVVLITWATLSSGG
jgi:NADH-quinone oxidoreductase subunit L